MHTVYASCLAILQESELKKKGKLWPKKKTYSLLSPLPSRRNQSIMILLNMEIQEPIRGEIFPTL